MTETKTPEWGELWLTEKGDVVVRRDEFWSIKEPVKPVRVRKLVKHVGYDIYATVGRALDARVKAMEATVEEIGDLRERITDQEKELRDLRVERDEAIARAEAAEAALVDVWLAGDLPTITEREPWRVLRAAAEVVHAEGFYVHVPVAELNLLADRLEDEAVETAKRDRLIEKATKVLLGAIRQSARLEDHARALADAGLLAEAVDQ